ncbi:MAG: multicopper oxidase family protein, partial [Acidimicrobiales bacterium]
MSISRRRFLTLAGGAYAGVVLVGCGRGQGTVGPRSAAVEAAERRRRKPGAIVRDLTLTAAPFTLDLAGERAETWAYNGSIPGPELRVKAGEVIRARLMNGLPKPQSTVIHWHGLALRNDMDGVPGITQDAVPPGGSFLYEFAAPDPGTFWFHPHSGLQADRGLYTALIVEDPAEPGRYDREITIVLDDWTSGIGVEPEDTLKELKDGAMDMAHGGGGMRMAMSDALGGDAGDVTYPLFLMNGRPPKDPPTFQARPGERLRLRLVNAGADTAFRVALGGHRLTVTHTDGFAVEPATADSVLIGMSERYDVLVTVAGAGVFPLVAAAEGKGSQAFGILRSGAGDAPAPDVRVPELDGKLVQLTELRAAAAVTLPPRAPDRTHILNLGAAKSGYQWTINGRAVTDDMKIAKQAKPIEVSEGERIRLVFDNGSTMF